MAIVPASSLPSATEWKKLANRAQQRRAQKDGLVASESLDLVIPGASYGVTTAANNFFSAPL